MPVVNLTTPHGEILAPPPPLLVGRRTIERQGGEMWAESSPERGTSVSFSLPAA